MQCSKPHDLLLVQGSLATTPLASFAAAMPTPPATETYATTTIACPPLVCPWGIPMLPWYRPRIIACTTTSLTHRTTTSPLPSRLLVPCALVPNRAYRYGSSKMFCKAAVRWIATSMAPQGWGLGDGRASQVAAARWLYEPWGATAQQNGGG
jgi:hypothetical protein